MTYYLAISQQEKCDGTDYEWDYTPYYAGPSLCIANCEEITACTNTINIVSNTLVIITESCSSV